MYDELEKMLVKVIFYVFPLKEQNRQQSDSPNKYYLCSQSLI